MRYAPQFFIDSPPHAVGRSDQFRRRRQPHGARLLHPQRALLARGVSRRRPAPGRGARDRRRLARTFVDELARAVRAGPGATRHVHLVLENDHNSARACARCRGQAPAGATAQWNDDLHHAAHVLATGERDGYYADYAAAPAAHARRGRSPRASLSRASRRRYRDGAPRGEPSADLPPTAFVNYLQNHDQVGNRAFGERVDRIGDAAALRALLRLPAAARRRRRCCSWARSTPPRRRSCSSATFTAILPRAVTDGRRREFARFAQFADAQARARIPDPNDARSFERSRARLVRTRARAACRLAGLCRAVAGAAARAPGPASGGRARRAIPRARARADRGRLAAR